MKIILQKKISLRRTNLPTQRTNTSVMSQLILIANRLFLFMLCYLSLHVVYAQNSGVGTPNPTHTLHVKPMESNPEQNPIRIENLQDYLPASDSMLVVVDPSMGVLRLIHIDSLRQNLQSNGSTSWFGITQKPPGFADNVDHVEDADADPSNEIQDATEVSLDEPADINDDGVPELSVQEAIDALVDKLPKGTFKSIGHARSAGLDDGDSFYAHPEGVMGCSGCIITLLPGMN